MKSVCLFLGFLFMVLTCHALCVETSGAMDEMGRGFQEEPLPMMPQMRPHGIERMDRMPEAEHPMWRHLLNLGLDEKQKAEIKEIRSRVTKEMIKMSADAHIAGIELKDLLDKDPVDIKAIEAKLKQIETAKTEMHLLFIRAREEAKSKLTPEQRKTFLAMPEKGLLVGRTPPGLRTPPPREKAGPMNH
jgi:Spy/CpxP family protein refolding chaperone